MELLNILKQEYAVTGISVRAAIEKIENRDIWVAVTLSSAGECSERLFIDVADVKCANPMCSDPAALEAVCGSGARFAVRTMGVPFHSLKVRSIEGTGMHLDPSEFADAVGIGVALAVVAMEYGDLNIVPLGEWQLSDR